MTITRLSDKNVFPCMNNKSEFIKKLFYCCLARTCRPPAIWCAGSVKTVLKDCGMGPWLVLVSPSFRENVVATCKIGSFLCSLDNLLQRNIIGNQILKCRSFEKRAIFDLLFTFSSHQGKVTKIPSAHISNTYIHIFCSPY